MDWRTDVFLFILQFCLSGCFINDDPIKHVLKISAPTTLVCLEVHYSKKASLNELIAGEERATVYKKEQKACEIS